MSAKRVMTDYYTKVRWRLGQLDQQLAELDEPLKASTGVAADSRKKIEKAVGEAHLGVATLLNSVEQLEKTALDVVDLQRRLKEETRNLIKPLKRLDGLVSDRERVTDAALNSWLLDLEEVAQLAAGALFPTGAKGLERVNDVLLQKLRPLVAFDFKRLLDKQQRKNSWTDAHARAVESARVEIEKPFLNLNAFLNRLAIEPMTATPVSRAVRTQHAAMRALEERLGALREDKPLRAFRGLLGDVRSIVRDVCRSIPRGSSSAPFSRSSTKHSTTSCPVCRNSPCSTSRLGCNRLRWTAGTFSTRRSKSRSGSFFPTASTSGPTRVL